MIPEYIAELPLYFKGYIFIYFPIYFFIMGMFYFVYLKVKETIYPKKIQKKSMQTKKMWHDLIYSLLSIIFFFPLYGLALFAIDHNYGLSYQNISEFGWPYFFISFILMLLFHDFFYYWLHRLLHIRFLFKKIHSVHHYSTNPTILTCFAFHPIEAILLSAWPLLFVFVIPLCLPALVIFGFVMHGFNFVGHLGYEFFPKKQLAIPIIKWFNSSTGHNLHHQRVNVNYGHYTLIWDTLFHTKDKNYEKIFLNVSNQSFNKKGIHYEH